MGTDCNDLEIENYTMLDQRIDNGNAADGDLVVVSNEEIKIANDGHFCEEFQNDLAIDVIQNLVHKIVRHLPAIIKILVIS